MNKWKVAFFMLSGVIVFSIIIIVYLATSPADDVAIPEPQEIKGNVLVVETTAKEFESIAKQYIGDALNKAELPIEIQVNDQIQLFGDVKIFNVTLPIVMNFEPIVSNGNLRLKQTAVNVGIINIDPTTVLKVMRDSIDFPSWMIVRPNEEEIYVDLSRINIASGSRVRAKEIDLKNDKIILEIIVPTKR